LRVQDHKSIAEYNSELFRITSQLTIYGHPVSEEEKIEKTLSIFHSTNLIIAAQYRNMNFVEVMVEAKAAQRKRLQISKRRTWWR
jgi:hypothetical protein